MRKLVQHEESGHAEDVGYRLGKQNSDYLHRFRSRCHLDQITDGVETDWESLVRLTGWAFGPWEHSGSGKPSKRDPASIVEEAEQGGRFRCTEYSIVLSAALNAMGIPARVLFLMKRQIERCYLPGAHVAVEAYLRDQERWAFADPQWNIVPVHEESPLNAVELVMLLQEGIIPRSGTPETEREISGFWRRFFTAADAFRRFLARQSRPSYASAAERELAWYWPWLRSYLYYISAHTEETIYDVPIDPEDPPQRLMLVPVGAPEPKVSHRRFPLKNHLYTNSLATFYAEPT